MEYILLAGLVLSLAMNAYLLRKQPKPQKSMTLEAQHVLAELMSGPALVKIDVLDKSQIFLRSPKTL